jgi:hypothetical protein
MQSCGVFFRKNSFYVVSESFTTYGIGVSVGPMFKVETQEPREVGEAVVAALNASRSGIPQPENMSQVQKELFRFTGARSWSDLAKGAQYAAVRRNDSTVTVEPHKAGSGAAFVPDGAAILCASANVDDIGRCVLSAIKLPEGV